MAFYFAWIDPNEVFGAQHLREDEEVLSFDIAHLEGQIPTLSIEIRNPKIGLLAPGRKQWALFSWTSQIGVTTLLFRGRLVGLPTNVFNEVVTLQFLARPQNYLAEKSAVAQSLKVYPYYDPIWVDQSKLDDPDTILEPYTQSWHIDRATLQLTTSDMIYGEDGTEEFRYEEAFYDSVALSFAQAPQTRVDFDGSVTWTQAGSGDIKFPHFAISNTPGGSSFVSGWPKPGAALQAGWSVQDASVGDLYNTQNAAATSQSGGWQNTEEKHANGDSMSVSWSVTGIGNPVFASEVTKEETQSGFLDENTGLNIPSSASEERNNLLSWFVAGDLTLHYDLSRGRTETVYFTMNSSLQDIITSPIDEPIDPIKLSMHGTDVGLPIDGVMPLGDIGRSSFFPTDRGVAAIQYPLLVARAHLMQSARAVKVSFDCSFERALNLSCRKNALLHDPRLVTGQAFGKITEYHIKGSGDSGELIGSVQLEATIGTGGQIEITEGTPIYADEGYVSVGYQLYSGAVTALPTNDMTFSHPVATTVDDGLVLPLTYDQVVVDYSLHPDSDAQRPVAPSVGSGVASGAGIAAAQADAAQAAQQASQTFFDELVVATALYLNIELKPVQGNDYGAAYDISVGTLIVPKMIDLEGVS